MHRLQFPARLSVAFSLICLMAVSIASAQNPNLPVYLSKYRQEVDKYRLQYETTSTSLRQYATLQTLASQEEAVQSMRDFLLIRSDVVLTHLDILDAELSDRQRLDPVWVASASAALQTQKKALQEHRSRSDIAVDRIKADQEAEWFFKNREPLLVVADHEQCLIGIGRMEESIEALENVKVRIDSWISTANMSETQRVEKKRGSDELGRTIDAAKKYVQDAKAYYLQSTKSSSTAQIYGSVRPSLLNAYSQVERGVGFAKELTQ